MFNIFKIYGIEFTITKAEIHCCKSIRDSQQNFHTLASVAIFSPYFLFRPNDPWVISSDTFIIKEPDSLLSPLCA